MRVSCEKIYTCVLDVFTQRGQINLQLAGGETSISNTVECDVLAYKIRRSEYKISTPKFDGNNVAL